VDLILPVFCCFDPDKKAQLFPLHHQLIPSSQAGITVKIGEPESVIVDKLCLRLLPANVLSQKDKKATFVVALKKFLPQEWKFTGKRIVLSDGEAFIFGDAGTVTGAVCADRDLIKFLSDNPSKRDEIVRPWFNKLDSPRTPDQLEDLVFQFTRYAASSCGPERAKYNLFLDKGKLATTGKLEVVVFWSEPDRQAKLSFPMDIGVYSAPLVEIGRLVFVAMEQALGQDRAPNKAPERVPDRAGEPLPSLPELRRELAFIQRKLDILLGTGILFFAFYFRRSYL